MHPDDGTIALDGGRIRALLAGTPFAEQVTVVEATGSTNEDAMARLDAGCPHGTVIVASAQTAGRGRLARRWYSAPGLGLYLSVVLRPAAGLRELTRWTIGSALAAGEACRACAGCDVEIEWPNDLFHRGRKLAGTLTEARTVAGAAAGLVIGTGFNVNHGSDDFPPELRGTAVSLRMAGDGRPVEREPLAAEYLRRLGDVSRRLERGEWSSVVADWSRLAPGANGRRVTVRSEAAGGARHDRGTTVGLDDDGALRVKLADGTGILRVRMSDSILPAEE